MSKKIIPKLAAITALPIVPMPLMSIVSCDNSELKISFPDQTLSGDSRSFKFEGESNNRARKGLKVEIVGEDSYLQYLSLESDVVSITRGGIEVKINISEVFNVKYTFSFSLRFTNIDTNQQITVDDFHIIFRNQPAEEDIVRIEHRSIEKAYGYRFTYKFYFSAMPLNGGVVNMFLVNPSSQFIHCQDESKVVRENDFYVLYANVDVELHVVTSLIAEFGFRLEFLNSFNKRQTEEFGDCALRFYADKDHKVIPIDYYVVENNIITGISSEVRQDTIQRFDTIIVPDGITSISESAFGAEARYNFDSITTLILPKTIATLPLNCFKALHSLYYIDLTDYTQWPSWFKTTTSESVFSTTPTTDFKYNGGIVWVRKSNNKLELRNTYVNPTFGYPNTAGKPTYWDVCEKEAIMPDSYYITEENEDGDIVLKGLNKQYKDTFNQYQVLKIPDNVTIIGNNAFSLLNRITYDTEGERYNRRLIPNKKLKKIETRAFAGASIGGCTLFDCPNLKEIGDSGFDEMMYSDTGNEYSYNSVTSMGGFFWKDCISLNKIGAHCFAVRRDGHPGCQVQPYFTIPASVTEIGEYLFVHEDYEPYDYYYENPKTASKIAFENCKNLIFNDRSFGHIGTMQEIDFSAVSYENFKTWTVVADSFLYAGQTFIHEEGHRIVPIVYLNKDLTDPQFDEIKYILIAAGLVDEYPGIDWEYERK